jgi:xylulokinase
MPDIGEIAGVTPTPGFTAPKVLWLRTHEPAVFSGMRYVASAKAYVHLKLTGTLLTDLSDGAGTLWLDEARRDWSDRALSASGVSRAHVPALVEGSAPAGFVRNSLCEEFGLTSPVMVAGGAGDVAAAAIGLGAVNEGDAFISLGTSCQLFVATSAYAPEEAPLLVHNFAHAIPGRWFRMAAMLNGGSCLRWIAGLLGEETRIEELLSVTERAYQGPLHLLFLPYLVGERTPHNNPNARGVLIGLTPATTRTDVVQSVLEGVAFSIREARLAVERLRLPLSSAGVVGGGSRSAFWMKLIASITGLPLVRYAESEQGAAFGAARLARLAFSGEPIVDVCRKLPAIDQFEPDGDLAPIYAERFDRFRQTYRELSWPRLWADNE